MRLFAGMSPVPHFETFLLLMGKMMAHLEQWDVLSYGVFLKRKGGGHAVHGKTFAGLMRRAEDFGS